MPASRSINCLTALALLCFVGCRKAEVTTYQVPKEAAPSMAAPAAGSGSATTRSAFAWQAPADWQAQPASAMRKGSFLVPGPDGTTADLSIISFPGEAGGLLSNVNRWRGQVGLPNLSSDELMGQMKTLDVSGQQFVVIEMAGSVSDAPTSILGGITMAHDETYFFKLMGPTAVVAAQHDAFIAFLKTVEHDHSHE